MSIVKGTLFLNLFIDTNVQKIDQVQVNNYYVQDSILLI